MAGRAQIHVQGLRELNATFRHAPRDVNRAYRAELRTVALPVQQEAQSLAVERIRRIGVPWSRFRIGITSKLVYVAPRQRGVKSRGDARFKRPNLARRMAAEVTGPALERNQHRIEADFDAMLDRLVRKWDHDGP